jgi:transposase-like protein
MVLRRKEGWTISMIAAAHDLSETTVRKWFRRHRVEGNSGLADRSSRPKRLRQPASQERICQIMELRRKRLTGWQIAQRLRMPRSTVAAVLSRVGLSRLCLLEAPNAPPLRYEREHTGELVHLDVKPLGRIGTVGHRIHGDRRLRYRGSGWEFVHVAIDATAVPCRSSTTYPPPGLDRSYAFAYRRRHRGPGRLGRGSV